MPLLNTANKIYAGSAAASKVYCGSNLVWQEEEELPVPEPHVPVAVHFDGTAVLRGPTNTSWTGVVNGPRGIMSFWFQFMASADFYTQTIIAQADTGVTVQRFPSTGDWSIVMLSAAVGLAVFVKSSSYFTSSDNPGWHHFLLAWDTSIDRRQLYIDGVDNTLDPSGSSTNVDYDVAKTIGICGDAVWTSENIFGDIADLYINYTDYLDISLEANRRKFFYDGKPVFLGADGSLPTGNRPIGFFANPVATWHQNLGTGGDIFTLTGALTPSSTSPAVGVVAAEEPVAKPGPDAPVAGPKA